MFASKYANFPVKKTPCVLAVKNAEIERWVHIAPPPLVTYVLINQEHEHVSAFVFSSNH